MNCTWSAILSVLLILLLLVCTGALLWYGVYAPCEAQRVARQVQTLGPALLHRQPIELARYAGRWYEAARLPNWFERDCECAIATYTPEPNSNALRVQNECVLANGRRTRSVQGRAEPVNASNTALRVSFAPAWLGDAAAGDYWILYVDPDYTHSLVGTPDKRYLWLLSRTPIMENETFAKLEKLAADKGFDTNALIRTRC